MSIEPPWKYRVDFAEVSYDMGSQHLFVSRGSRVEAEFFFGRQFTVQEASVDGVVVVAAKEDK